MPKLAELLLPHIFLDIAVYASDSYPSIHYHLSKGLTGLMTQVDSDDTKVQGLLLKCLGHLHSFHIDTFNQQSFFSEAPILKDWYSEGHEWDKVRNVKSILLLVIGQLILKMIL